jgi:hypothetical protein
VVLIISMRIEASDIGARAILQDATPLRMPLAGGRLTDVAEGGHPGKRSTRGHQKFTSGKLELSTCSLSGHP